MKKLTSFLVFAVVICQFVISQIPYYHYDTIANYREHGEQYLLPEPFDNNCIGLDLWRFVLPEEECSNYHGQVYDNYKIRSDYIANHGSIFITSVVCTNPQYIWDVAQPYYVDSTVTVIGVSIMTTLRYYAGRTGYLCIADSNMNILRKTPIKDGSIAYEDYGLYWGNYEEFFFDTTIGVQGKFYAVLDNPKPLPFTGYNWEYSYNPRNDIFDCHLIAVQNFPNHPNYCTATMLPKVRRTRVLGYEEDFPTIDYPLSDTTWHEVTAEPTNLSTYYWSKHCYASAYFIFPILDEIVTPNDTTSSDIESITVEKYTNIFPNPATEKVSIQCSFKIKGIEVFNGQGQKTNEKKINAYNTTLDVSSYSKGSYIIKINTQSGYTTKKIVVK